MAASVLFISADPDQHRSAGEIIRSPAYTLVVADDIAAAQADGGAHALLMLDAAGDPDAVMEVCRQTRSDAALQKLPLLVIARTDDVDERIQFLEAGADDVIGRPYDSRELEARVEALVARFQRTTGTGPIVDVTTIDPRRRRTVAVFSPKGGVGTTTIATNLAVVVGRHRPEQVLLMDLDLQFGGVAVHLDLRPAQTIIDLIRDDQALVDPELFRGYATRHDSGLHVLAGPASPEQTELLNQDDLVRLLDTASEAYEVVVVDAGSTLDERTLTILDWADAVLVVFHPEIPALKAVHSLLDYLTTVGEVIGKATFVLNNAFARQALRMRDIEQALGTKVAIELPYDQLAYLNAANEGIPVVIGAPRTPAAIRLTSLAGTVFDDDTTTAAAAPAPRAGLGGFLRRSGGR